MTESGLNVRVLPDLPDALAPATPGGQRRRENPLPTDGATALDPAASADPTPRPADLRVLPGGADEQPKGDADRRRMLVRAHRFVQAVVEIVSGDRPCTQLVRWTDREVYDDLTTRVAALAGTVGSVPATERPRQGRVGQGLPAARRRRRGGRPRPAGRPLTRTRGPARARRAAVDLHRARAGLTS